MLLTPSQCIWLAGRGRGALPDTSLQHACPAVRVTHDIARPAGTKSPSQAYMTCHAHTTHTAGSLDIFRRVCCRHAPPLPLNTLTLKELHMLRTLPPRSAGGGPGHARLLAALHDRPPPLHLQVLPQALSPRP